MNVIDFINKDHNIPINISKSTVRKYKFVIYSDYGKYISAIASCGGVCMLSQFIELVSVMDGKDNLTYSGYQKRARSVIDELETFGFVETNSLNRNKYVLLKHPAVALAEGDYKTYKRVSEKHVFKSGRFVLSILKMQFLLDYGYVYEYAEMFEQLVMVTQLVYGTIVKDNNKFGYDIELIEQIIKLADYKEITELLDNKPEYNHKIGILRNLWTNIGGLYRKLSLKGCLIKNEPLHLEVFIQNDGFVTLHYVPVIVVYDTQKGFDFFDTQRKFFFDSFITIQENNTLGMKEEYQKRKQFGFEHFNRIGYSVMVVGMSEESVEMKKQILNEAYYNGGNRSPMIEPCSYYIADISKYLSHSSLSRLSSKTYDDTVKSLSKIITEMVGDVNEIQS